MKTVPFKDYESNKLPLGIVIDGKIHRDFEYKKMTGKLRSELGARVRKKGTKDMMSFVLSGIITKIGPIEKPTQKQLQSLSFVDKDYILYMLNKDSQKKDIAEYPANCQGCGEKMEFPVNFNEVEITYAEEADYKIDGDRVYFETKVDDKPLSFYIPTIGSDESFAGEEKDFFGKEHHILSTCLREFDDNTNWTVGAIEEMDADTIDEIISAIDQFKLGPDVIFLVSCPHEECRFENRIEMDLTSFFVTPLRRNILSM